MSKPPKIDSMKETIRREKGGGGHTSPVPSSGSGAKGGHPSEPPQPADPASGVPYAEPGFTRSGKRSKRLRGY